MFEEEGSSSAPASDSGCCFASRRKGVSEMWVKFCCDWKLCKCDNFDTSASCGNWERNAAQDKASRSCFVNLVVRKLIGVWVLGKGKSADAPVVVAVVPPAEPPLTAAAVEEGGEGEVGMNVDSMRMQASVRLWDINDINL